MFDKGILEYMRVMPFDCSMGPVFKPVSVYCPSSLSQLYIITRTLHILPTMDPRRMPSPPDVSWYRKMDISGYSGSFPNQVIREPLHEQKGYYTSATGESEPRGRSSSIVGYPREAYPLRHPYEGRLEADYGVYKEKQQQFIEARSTYRELSDRSVGVNVPQGTRVYGSGRATTPPYHRQLAPLAAAAAGCAKV